MKQIRSVLILSVAVIFLFLILPFATQAQSASSISTVTNNPSTSDSLALSLKYLEEAKAIGKQQADDLVTENYNKLKSSGKIPVITGPTTIVNADPKTLGGFTASANSINPNYIIMQFDHQFSSSHWGTPWFIWQNYDASTHTYQAHAMMTPVGLGACTSDGWTGFTFTYSGPNGAYYTVTAKGYEQGTTTAAGVGSGSTEIDYVIKDDNTGAINSQVVYSVTETGIGFDLDNKAINRMMSQAFTTGHTYSIYFRIVNSAALAGTGTGNSDYYDNGGLWMDSVTLQ
jgi:hypothetical protein